MKSKLSIQRINTIAIGVSTVFLLIAGGILTAQYAVHTKKKIIWNENETKLKKLKMEIKESSSSIERYKKEREEFSKLLFDERDVPTFLDGISQFAKQSLVNVVDMKTEKFTEVEIPAEMSRGLSDVEKKRLQRKKQDGNREESELQEILTLSALPIRMNITGTYEALVNFLAYLEGYKQLLTVSDVEIASRIEYPVLSCDFVLRLYSLKKLGELK